MRKYRCKRCGVKGQLTRWSKVFKGFVCINREECNNWLEFGELKKQEKEK